MFSAVCLWVKPFSSSASCQFEVEPLFFLILDLLVFHSKCWAALVRLLIRPTSLGTAEICDHKSPLESDKVELFPYMVVIQKENWLTALFYLGVAVTVFLLLFRALIDKSNYLLSVYLHKSSIKKNLACVSYDQQKQFSSDPDIDSDDR